MEMSSFLYGRSMMIGAIVGDIVGSRFEGAYEVDKNFEFFDMESTFTEDTLMTLAVGKTLCDCNGDYESLGEKVTRNMRFFGEKYPHVGYGPNFYAWLSSTDNEPYNSYCNGAAMSVSACAWLAETLEEAISLTEKVTAVSYNHPEGMKGAEAVTVAIFMALKNRMKEEIAELIHDFYYSMDFSLEDLDPDKDYNAICQGTVPLAFKAFFDSTSFEDALRRAISLVGYTDTVGAITGSLAEAYYSVPSEMREQALTFLDDDLLEIIADYEMHPAVISKKAHKGKC